MAKYKTVKKNTNTAEKKTEVTNTVKGRRKSNIMRILALVFAAMLLLSMAVIFPMTSGAW
jgi:cytoskeletal protein RodZ